jgi:hypothetical protein
MAGPIAPLAAAVIWVVAGAVQAQSAPVPPTPILHLTDPTGAIARPYARLSAVEVPVQPRTEVDHRFAPHGLVGQAGYLCGIGGIGPDDDPPRGGPSSLWGHQGTFLGAKLGYAFR